MSHMHELSELKKSCDTTGQCVKYELRLQQEQQKVDHAAANANQAAAASGLVVGIIGFFILLTPFSKFIKRLQKIILPSLAVIIPVIAGLAIGAYVGFAISFSACFKQQCSFAESSSIFIIPLFSLILTIPLAIMIYKKRSGVVKSIDRIKSSAWIIIGVLVILFAAVNVYSAIDATTRNSEAQKTDLMNVE